MDCEQTIPRVRRQRVLKGAAIVAGDHNSEIACTMRNQSEHGAELTVPLDARVPKSFLLYVPVDGLSYQTVIRWRRQEKLGVSFVGTGPKPRFRY